MFPINNTLQTFKIVQNKKGYSVNFDNTVKNFQNVNTLQKFTKSLETKGYSQTILDVDLGTSESYHEDSIIDLMFHY